MPSTPLFSMRCRHDTGNTKGSFFIGNPLLRRNFLFGLGNGTIVHPSRLFVTSETIIIGSTPDGLPSSAPTEPGMAPDYSPAAVCAICVLISANPRCFETKVVFAGTAARRTGVVAVVVEGGEQPHRAAAPRRKRNVPSSSAGVIQKGVFGAVRRCPGLQSQTTTGCWVQACLSHCRRS